MDTTGPGGTADSKGRWRIARLGFFAAALFLGIKLLSTTMGQPRSPASLVGDHLPDMVRLASAGEQCEDYPWLMHQELMYSNLNNGGPDRGKGEGMVIKALDMGGNDPRRFGKTTYIVLNATNDDYKAANPPGNRLIGGQFGAFNLPGGGKLDFKMSFRDEDGKPLTLKHFALSFFDLDTGANNMLYESVSFTGFSEYITTHETELEVTSEEGNMTKFQATTEGDVEDNPCNEMAMSNQQRNRVVTFLFSNVTEIIGSAAVTAGAGARLFEFVSKNTLRCARTLHITPQTPLQDLPFQPPLEIPVAVDDKNATFVSWLVNVGDKVIRGHTLAKVHVDANIKEIKAPHDGTIIGAQPLSKGDLIGERLISLNIAVIKLDQLAPLHTSSKTEPAVTVSGEHRYFEKYHVSVGDNVEKGGVVATTILFDGTNKSEVLASKGGRVAALQPLHPGDPCAKVADGVLVTVGKFGPLKAGGETPARLISGAVFSKWEVNVGDSVKVGDSIAQIKSGAGIIHNIAAYGGKIVELQHLFEGSILQEMPDELFAMIKTDGKLRAVSAQGDEQVVKVPKGLEFRRWGANVGDAVKKGDKIAVLSSATVTAEKDGIITSRVEGLKPGDNLDEVMSNLNLATVGKKLRPLVCKSAKTPALAPRDGLEFVQWVKDVGEPVNFGDLIAIMKGANNELVNVRAGVKGVIAAEQDLKPGDKIDDLIDKSSITGGFSGRVLALVDIQLQKMQAGPLEKASSYKWGMQLIEWNKELGDKVSKGDVIATFSKDKIPIDLKASKSGFVTAIQDGLIKGSILTSDPGAIAIVHDKFRPLKVLYAEHGHSADEDATFIKYLVELGDIVEMDQGLFEVTTAGANNSKVKAKRAGIVVARQEPLKKGDKINKVLDVRTLVVVGPKLRPLKVGFGEKAADCREGRVFQGWVKRKGDKVKEGDVIAKVAPAGGKVGDANAKAKAVVGAAEIEDVKAKGTGTIVDYQEALKEGMVIDDVMQDRNLAVFGHELRYLDARTEGAFVYAPAGCTFVKWHVKTGDLVRKRAFVATLKAETGEEFKVQTPHSGVIKARQFFEEGDVIDDVCADRSLVVIGKLPKLLINEGMAPVIAQGQFKEWKVETGSTVKKGDTIAVVTHANGQSEIIKAPKDGPVVRCQDELVPGSHLDTVLEAGDLCVIGRFVALQPSYAQTGIDAPRQAIFKRWMADTGSSVDKGDPIAEVFVESPSEWQTETIKAPTSGSISAKQPLKPGMTIGHQQMGPSIATIYTGPSWWSCFLGILAIIICCLCCLLFFLCFKRKPGRKDEARTGECREGESRTEPVRGDESRRVPLLDT